MASRTLFVRGCIVQLYFVLINVPLIGYVPGPGTQVSGSFCPGMKLFIASLLVPNDHAGVKGFLLLKSL